MSNHSKSKIKTEKWKLDYSLLAIFLIFLCSYTTNYSFAQAVPNAPTNLVVTPINTGGMIQFVAPTNGGGSAITNYQYSTDNGVTWVTPSPAITSSPLIIGSGLTNCTSYQLKLRAVNVNGSGTASQAVTLTPTASANMGINWASRTSAADETWVNVAYGNGVFVAVAISGTGNRVMTSPDGITWTARTSAVNNYWWGLTYGNGVFVAVANTGTGNRVMTSPDGITWTARTPAVDNKWVGVSYGNGLFVAVSYDGTGNRVMTSPDGITWTIRTSAADNYWRSVTYGNGLFVAVSQTGTGNRVMSSPNGITWTARTSAADNNWWCVTYGNGVFVAVANSGTGNRVMTSPDGITWTSRTSAADNQWVSVTYGNNLFVAVSIDGPGNRVMTSPDGITWTSRTSAADNNWQGVTYGNGVFVAVGYSGTGNRVMTSTFSTAPDVPITTSVSASGTTSSINFTQTTSVYAPAVSNYQYSIDNGNTWTTCSPAATTSPITITGLPSGTTNIILRAINSVGTSCQGVITLNTWTGTTSNNWNTATNWSKGTVPTNTEKFNITSGTPQLNADLTLSSPGALTISGTGTLTINAGKSLTIGSGATVDFGGKSVTLKSDATGTASIGKIDGTLSNATNVTVERFVPAKRAWRFIGAPLIGVSNNSIFYNWQNNGSAVANYGVELWSPLGTSAPSSSNSGMAYYFGGTSIKEYNSASNVWNLTTNTNTSTLFDGTTNKAYGVFVTGPFTTDGSGNINTGSSVTTLSATGTLIQGTHTKSLGTATAGQYFLVGNPYASAVSPATVSLTNLASNFYMWDPNCAGTYNAGQYNTYNRTAATYSLVTNSVAATVYTNTTPIQSGQAFFVQASAAGTTSLTFSETDKVSGSTNIFRTSNSNVQTLRHTLKKSINGVVTNIDGALGVFYNGGNAAVDYNDAAKFSNSTENIALRRANGSFAIEERPLVTENDTLFVRLTNTQQSTYTLELTGENFTNTLGLTATLKDAYTNTNLPLSITDTNRYNFTVDVNAASTGDRFMIVFKTNGTLPVQFTHINATQKGAAVQVDWKVATEQNIKQYVVEKSTNGINFTAIATQAANNIDNSSYTAIDNSPITGSNYYRVLSTDNNGKQQYSNVAVVKIGGKQSSISVYPNPIAGNVMNLQLENIAKGNYTIQLVNTQGSVVIQTKLQHAGGSGTQSIDLPNTLSSGNYVLKATADNGVVFTEKVVLSSKF